MSAADNVPARRRSLGGESPQEVSSAASDRIDAFISYARRPRDREFVDWLSEALRQSGKQVWLDRASIEPAADWRERIVKGIERASAFIFVISPDSAISRECTKELDIAVGGHKRIIPVILRSVSEDALPLTLTTPNWISFEDDADRAQKLQELIEALDSDLPWRDQSARLTVRAEEWLGSRKDSSLLLRGSDLRAAENWYEQKEGHKEQPTDKQYQYLAASRKGAAKRQRTLLSGVAFALALAVALSIVALVQRNQAVSNQHIAQSGQFAAESVAALDSDPEMSALLSIRALDVRYTPGAEDALRAAVTKLQLLKTFLVGSPAKTVATNRNGSQIAVGTEAGTVPIWSDSNGRRLAMLREPLAGGLGSSNFSIEGNSITSVSYSADGTKILTASDDTNARIWDVSTGRTLRVFVASNTLNDATFSPDGAEVVTASEDGNIVIWDVATGGTVKTLHEPRGSAVMSAVFSPNGMEVLAASSDGTARIWSTVTYDQLAVLREPAGAGLNDAAFSRDGAEVVTASEDGTARIWNARTGAELMQLGIPSGSDLTSASFSPDGSMIVTAGSGRTATIWDAYNGEQLTLLDEPGGGRISYATFTPGGDEVATTSNDGTVRLWDANPRQLIRAITVPGGASLNDASFNPAGNEIVTADSDGTARIWDVTTGRQVRVLDEGDTGVNFANAGNAINSASFSPDGDDVVTASNDGTARIWNAQSGRLLKTLETVFPTYSAAFSSNGSRVMTATDAADIVIWNSASGKEISEFFAGQASLYHASYNPDATEIVTASNDGTARIWKADSDAFNGKQLAVFREPRGAPIGSAAFSPNGLNIVTVSDDGTARIWSIRTGRQLTVVTDPSGARIYTAAFNRTGSEIVTSSGAGSATIWDASTGKILSTLGYSQGATIEDASFSLSGGQVVTAGYDGVASVWSAETAGSLPAVVSLALSRVKSGLAPNEFKADLAAISG